MLYVAMIIFACVSANHLGFVQAVEELTGKPLLIVNCVKCFTFWCVLVYWLFASEDVICSVAFAFLSSYIAIWLELLFGFIDNIYLMLYEKIYPTADDDTPSADPDKGRSDSAVSEL